MYILTSLSTTLLLIQLLQFCAGDDSNDVASNSDVSDVAEPKDAQGSIGVLGPAGEPGPMTPMSRVGPEWFPGFPGPLGEPELPYGQTPDRHTINVLVKHSQSQSVPGCESGHTKLWEGYSLLFREGDQRQNSQDLGDASSCPRKFSLMPVEDCSFNAEYGVFSLVRFDRSIWLSTNNSIAVMPFNESAVAQYISRCVVCEVPAYVMAIHSRSFNIPECPGGWFGLWTGYSFIRRNGKDGGGDKSLSSPGSCLEYLRPVSFIECNGNKGRCWVHGNQVSFWMMAIEGNQQLRNRTLNSRISHCQVCEQST